MGLSLTIDPRRRRLRRPLGERRIGVPNIQRLLVLGFTRNPRSSSGASQRDAQPVVPSSRGVVPVDELRGHVVSTNIARVVETARDGLRKGSVEDGAGLV